MKTPRKYDNKKLSAAIRSGRVSPEYIAKTFERLYGGSALVSGRSLASAITIDALTHLEIISVKTIRDLHGVIACDRYYQTLAKIARETAQEIKKEKLL